MSRKDVNLWRKLPESFRKLQSLTVGFDCLERAWGMERALEASSFTFFHFLSALKHMAHIIHSRRAAYDVHCSTIAVISYQEVQAWFDCIVGSGNVHNQDHRVHCQVQIELKHNWHLLYIT